MEVEIRSKGRRHRRRPKEEGKEKEKEKKKEEKKKKTKTIGASSLSTNLKTQKSGDIMQGWEAGAAPAAPIPNFWVSTC